MEYRDYYKILGVPKTASQAEIKKAFRKLAREHHPDVNRNDTKAEQRFKDVNEAHAVLGDPQKRKQYDALGPNWEQFARAGAGAPAGGGSPFAGFGFGSPGGGNVRYEFRTTGGEDISDFSDFFRAVFGSGGPAAGTSRTSRSAGGSGSRVFEGSGDFDDILAEMGIDGGAGGSRAGRPRAPHADSQPAVAEATAELDLEEAFRGTTRRVDIDGKRLEVTIPAGVDTGSRVRLTGRGPGGGDLVVNVRMRPHPVFTRRGADLERELPLTLEEALLGAEVPVGTLKGRLVLTIPPGTQNGRTFRLTGQGMPRLKGGATGDLYVRSRVVLPTTLTDEARRAARRFLDLVDQPNPRETTR